MAFQEFVKTKRKMVFLESTQCIMCVCVCVNLETLYVWREKLSQYNKISIKHKKKRKLKK